MEDEIGSVLLVQLLVCRVKFLLKCFAFLVLSAGAAASAHYRSMMLVRILLVVVAVCQGLRTVSRLGVTARGYESVMQTAAIHFGFANSTLQGHWNACIFWMVGNPAPRRGWFFIFLTTLHPFG